jgi:hypothetical protein
MVIIQFATIQKRFQLPLAVPSDRVNMSGLIIFGEVSVNSQRFMRLNDDCEDNGERQIVALTIDDSRQEN